jgi:hypothetical protein
MSLISILIFISIVTYNCIIKSNDNNCWSHWLCLITGIVDSNPTEGMDVHLCVFVTCCICCGLCHVLITHSEESYCMCVCVCVLNCVSSRNSTMRWPRPNLSGCTSKKWQHFIYTCAVYFQLVRVTCFNNALSSSDLEISIQTCITNAFYE